MFMSRSQSLSLHQRNLPNQFSIVPPNAQSPLLQQSPPNPIEPQIGQHAATAKRLLAPSRTTWTESLNFTPSNLETTLTHVAHLNPPTESTHASTMTTPLSPPPTYQRFDPESLSPPKTALSPNLTAFRLIAIAAAAIFLLLVLFQAQILTLLDEIMRTLKYSLPGRGQAGGVRGREPLAEAVEGCWTCFGY
ncbi:uncharacterized protein BDZ99DRAFT_525900 [Mytilinidion resinicola]|uniref:Uncharacterized protein n=1 Tax=Mytilinidion resinicola TaxID=574789 RepID=A0A6A6Y661_9PEZI|nr:uncharacterized protein BDZ99DRAFT_525900 [Mytilinidion resinicola]KAF2804311.1 hypothetical protein BDZ99DRAFT_525900 [Mytilinidion resinicola]